MKKGVFVLFIALCLLCSAFALAQTVTPKTFFVKVEPVKDKILDPAKDSADMYISVENKGTEKDTFKLLYLDDPKWSYQVLPEPINKQITVEPGETGKFHILVKGNVGDGFYGVKVSVQSLSTGNIIDNVMRIRVGERAPSEPPAANFDVGVSVPAQMDPKGTYNVIVSIKNNNERLLEGVNIKLLSNLITEDTDVTVNPNETKSVSFAVLLMENIRPQKDQLHIAVSYGGEEFYAGDYNFEVVEYVPPFRTDVLVNRKFLRQERTITITNDGNAPKSDSVRLETSLRERFFSRSTPKFTSMKEGGRTFFVWQVSLGPEESAEIMLTTSYRLLVLFALVIIALLGYRIATSNPMVVKKKTVGVRKHGSAITDLAVVIYLKNRGKEPVKDIRVVERITKMVHLKNDSFAGSMHPVKMHSHPEGTLLEYRFGELAPGDERLIKYKVYSKLPIFGNLTIKPTAVEFTKRNGAKRKSWSNTLSVDTDAPPPAPKPAAKSPPRPAHVEHNKPEHAHHHK
ncbi:hypothetical protein JW898_03575 [Candidatus Woesearchaeota archaeon]|nr:hypothetical protein [Candidatus Woesearchaeota archaeon]